MENDLKIKIATSLDDYIVKHKLSQNSFSKKANVSPAYIIAIRKKEFFIKVGDKQTEIPDKYFIRIANEIGVAIHKTYWQLKPTIQLKTVVAQLSDAKNNNEVAVLIGETGSGKSFGCDVFAKKFHNEVFKIKVGSSDTLSDLTHKIAKAIRLELPQMSISSKIGSIAMKLQVLSENGVNPMLIFDEAEYLRQPALCTFKELYDELNRVCSLVLIGTDELTQNIERMIKKRKPGIAQLFRRIKFKIHRLPEIDTTYSIFLDGIDDDLKRWLQINCNNYGELHDVLEPALRESDRLGEPLTLNLVKLILSIK